jgi:GT2 family glycosyltransferase
VLELSVIIVNWNSRDFLRQCLASLTTYCRSIPMEIIVVDGGSFDGCGEMLAREFSSVIFIQSEKNIGFSRANNLGARRASGRCLLFLNPDTEFFEDSIRVLMEQLRTLPQAGVVGCKLLNSDRSLQTSCVQAFPTVCNQVLNSDFLRRKFPKWKMWGIAALFANPPRPAVVQVISGACILTRRDIFDAVGGFTEQYFMYGEDADLCFKVARAGHLVYYAPQTSIVHHGGGSSRQAQNNFSNVMMRESIHCFLKLNHGKPTAATYRVAMSVLSVVRLPLILVLLPISRGKLVRHGTGSLRKWFSILRWGLGLESWAQSVNELKPLTK